MFIIQKNKITSLLLLISIVFGAIFFMLSSKLISWLSEKINDEEITLSEDDLLNYLSNPSIKFYLFNEKNNEEIKKKCKEFIENNIEKKRNFFDQKGFMKVFKDLLIEDQNLRKLILDSKKFFNDLKVNVCVNLLQIIFLLTFVVCFCILLHSIKIQFGVLRLLTTLISLLFIVSVMIVCFKIIFKIEKNKGNIKN